MRAIRVHSPGDASALRLEQVPDPKPRAGEVLVRLEAIGINFIEVYQRRGWYPKAHPYTPGAEGAGTVVEVGEGVTGVAVGERVASVSFGGSYAELALVPADRLVTLPPEVSAEEGAAAMLQGMTAHYLAKSTFPLAAGHRCLIHAAAGGVGLLLCQIAKIRGATVIGTTSTPAKAELALAAGADHVVLYGDGGFASEVKRLTGGVGVSVVYDSVGKETFQGSLDSLAPRGMLVLFGQSSGQVPPLDPQILNQKGSLFLTRPALVHHTATRSELTMRASEVLGWVADGALRLRIGGTWPLEQAGDAHSALESRTTTGKLLLIP
jgi:NADPH2:quinone reductase